VLRPDKHMFANKHFILSTHGERLCIWNSLRPDPDDGVGAGGAGADEDPEIWVLTMPSVVAAIQQDLGSAFICVVNVNFET